MSPDQRPNLFELLRDLSRKKLMERVDELFQDAYRKHTWFHQPQNVLRAARHMNATGAGIQRMLSPLFGPRRTIDLEIRTVEPEASAVDTRSYAKAYRLK